MRILLATYGSEHSGAAVDETVRQHLQTDSEVRVISVIEPTRMYPVEGMDVNVYDDIESSRRERASVAVEKAAAKLRGGDESRKLKVTTKVLSGSPKRLILEEADAFGADLIVVGSHGQGALERFLLGSVSQAVALHAKCSVEIVRHPEKETQQRVTTLTG